MANLRNSQSPFRIGNIPHLFHSGGIKGQTETGFPYLRRAAWFRRSVANVVELFPQVRLGALVRERLTQRCVDQGNIDCLPLMALGFLMVAHKNPEWSNRRHRSRTLGSADRQLIFPGRHGESFGTTHPPTRLDGWRAGSQARFALDPIEHLGSGMLSIRWTTVLSTRWTTGP